MIVILKIRPKYENIVTTFKNNVIWHFGKPLPQECQELFEWLLTIVVYYWCFWMQNHSWMFRPLTRLHSFTLNLLLNSCKVPNFTQIKVNQCHIGKVGFEIVASILWYLCSYGSSKLYIFNTWITFLNSKMKINQQIYAIK